MNAYEVAIKAVNFEKTDCVPVVLSMTGLIYSRLAGVPDREYYTDPKEMLEVQEWFYDQIPEVFTFPGIWPDFGAIAELGSLGAQVIFAEDAPPFIEKPALASIEEIKDFNPPDPKKAESTARNLEFLRYFNEHLSAKLRKEYGFIDGALFCGGPPEIAALLLGYDRFFFGMYDQPQLIHQLLRKITDFVKSYLQAQMEIVGSAKRVYVWDHTAGMLSRDIYSKFVHPYLYEIFDFVKNAEIRQYHNENNYPHLMDLVKDLPCNVCHIGPQHDLVETKGVLHKCLMGNLHPIADLVEASDEEFRDRCQTIIGTAGPGGGLWLSTAGGMAPQTTMARLKLLVEVARETLIR